MKKLKISSMQVEVWKMKDKVYEETKNMNSKEFFNYIRNENKKFSYDCKDTAVSP